MSYTDLVLLAVGIAPMAVLCAIMRSRLKAARAQTAAQREQAWFAQSTVHALSAHLAVLDSGGVILKVNAAWQTAGDRLGEGELRDAVGTNYLRVCDELSGKGNEGAAAIAAGIRAVATGQRGEACAEYCRRDGETNRWFLCRVTCFPGNSKVRVVVSHEDITDRKKLEEAADEARRTADAANQAKTAFLANMSHEIRTPMTAMLGYADVLLDAKLPENERNRCIQVIRRNGEHLLSLINDVLDISKIEANKYAVECVKCDLRNLLADVVALTRVKAIQKGLNFKVVVDGPVPKEVRTDPLRLKQILVNLIGNAVKFTTAGGVYVRVSCHDRLISSTLHVDIVDTGVGMSEQQVSRLFRAFTQADESTTRKFGGSGLGLVISKKLSQLLGGDISVNSKVGEGTCFSVWVDSGQLGGVRLLPALDESDLASAPSATVLSEQRFDGKVLLVEDGEDNQQLISLLLRNVGINVTLAPNGKEGVEVGSRQQFDLILMDMQMPELDGYTAARKLRDAGISTPIVALTANAMADDRAKCLAAGCDEYLAKPIRMDQFTAILGRFLRHVGAQASSESPAALTGSDDDKGPVLRSGLAGNEKFKGVLDRFIQRLPERVEEMQRLFREADMEQLARAVHQLKGAAGGYGFPQITAMATRAEQSIKRSDEMKAIAAQVEELVAMVRRVEGFPTDLTPVAPRPAEPPVEAGPKLRVDPVTGLPNRNHLTDRLSTLLALARRRNLPLACIAVQFPRFREFANNPAFDAFEDVVKRIAVALEQQVSGDMELFRADRATFVLVVPEMSRTRAQPLAAKMLQPLKVLEVTGTSDDTLPWCTFGISELHLTTTCAAELLTNAFSASEPSTALAA